MIQVIAAVRTQETALLELSREPLLAWYPGAEVRGGLSLPVIMSNRRALFLDSGWTMATAWEFARHRRMPAPIMVTFPDDFMDSLNVQQHDITNKLPPRMRTAEL